MKRIMFFSALMFCFTGYGKAQKKQMICYTYHEVIKLSNYIKDLEEKDSLNAIQLNKYENETTELRAQVKQDKEEFVTGEKLVGRKEE